MNNQIYYSALLTVRRARLPAIVLARFLLLSLSLSPRVPRNVSFPMITFIHGCCGIIPPVSRPNPCTLVLCVAVQQYFLPLGCCSDCNSNLNLNRVGIQVRLKWCAIDYYLIFRHVQTTDTFGQNLLTNL